MYINVLFVIVHKVCVCVERTSRSVYVHIWGFHLVIVGASISSALHYLTILSDYADAECSDFHSSWNSTVIYMVTIIRLADNVNEHRQAHDERERESSRKSSCQPANQQVTTSLLPLGSHNMYIYLLHSLSLSLILQSIIQFDDLKVDFPPERVFAHSTLVLSNARGLIIIKLNVLMSHVDAVGQFIQR